MLNWLTNRNKSRRNGTADHRTAMDVMTGRRKTRSLAAWQHPLPLRLVLLGREHAGKSAILTSFDLVFLGEYLGSGLQMNVLSDNGQELSPLVINDRIKKCYGRLQHLTEGGRGLPTTVKSEPVNFVLCEGESPRLELLIAEEIGQVISGTSNESSPEELARYQDFLNRMSQADVIAVVVNPPGPDPDTWAELQWKKDLMQYVGYLNEGLRQHAGPVSVAIVVNKIDALFDDEESARTSLSDDVLREALKPLVKAVEMSRKVVHAAIIPTSVFGLGQSVRCEPHDAIGEFDPDNFDDNADDSAPRPWPQNARDHEPTYVAAESSGFEPFNVRALALWSMLAAALPKEIKVLADDGEPDLARCCRLLSEDLRELKGWIVPIKKDLIG